MLYASSVSLQNITDIDSLLTPCLKSLEAAPWRTRRALVDLGTTLLLITQVDSGSASTGSNESENGNIRVPDPSAVHDHRKSKLRFSAMQTGLPEGKARLLPVTSMLERLSVAYNRPSNTSKGRNAIIEIYAVLFHRLGTPYVDPQYSVIIRHLFNEIGTGLASRRNRYEQLLARHYIHLLAGNLVAESILSEQGKYNAMNDLKASYVYESRSLPPDNRQISDGVRLLALQEFSFLCRQFGTNTNLVNDADIEALLKLAEHPDHAVRCHATVALTSVVSTNPAQLGKCITVAVDRLDDSLSSEGLPNDNSLTRIDSLSIVTAALIATSSRFPLYFSVDIATRLMSLAIRLLKVSGDHQLGKSLTEIRSAWHIINGLVTLGSSFTRVHLPQLFLLWKNAFPKVTSKETSLSQTRTAEEWLFLLKIREAALSCLHTFIKCNHADSSTSEIGRRVITILDHGLAFAKVCLVNALPSSTAQAPQSQLEAESNLKGAYDFYCHRLLTTYLILGMHQVSSRICIEVADLCITTLAELRISEQGSSYIGFGGQAPAVPYQWDSTDGISMFCCTTVLSSDLTSGAASASCDPLRQQETIEFDLENFLYKPALDALEHDLQIVFVDGPYKGMGCPERGVSLIDSAIRLFGATFAFLSETSQSHYLSQLANMQDGLMSGERKTGSALCIGTNILAAIREAIIAISTKRKKLFGDSFLREAEHTITICRVRNILFQSQLQKP